VSVIDQAFVFLSMNAVVEEIETKYLKSPKKMFRQDKISMTIGSCQMHETESGRVIIVNLPAKIASVIVTPAAKPEKALQEYLDMIEIAQPGKTIEIG
jgi:hypothetical protein